MRINSLPSKELRELLHACCGSVVWVEGMLRRFPMESEAGLFAAAVEVWRGCGEGDWREAFAHHPKIGDMEGLKNRFAAVEQAGTANASEEVLVALAEGNKAYEEQFGYIFIVQATGKTAAEMLALLRERLGNDAKTELLIAMGEQEKITRIRLEKLLA